MWEGLASLVGSIGGKYLDSRTQLDLQKREIAARVEAENRARQIGGGGLSTTAIVALAAAGLVAVVVVLK